MAETTRIIRPQACAVNSRVPRQRSNGCFGFRAARSMSIDSSVSTNGASMRHSFHDGFHHAVEPGLMMQWRSALRHLRSACTPTSAIDGASLSSWPR